MKKEIAILLTSYNRREKTLQCLKLLCTNKLPKNYAITIFLVDDGSTDGTSEAIQKQFPTVQLIKGNGTLFWNQGMRLAWKTATAFKNYDFYIWLNDDTFLEENALKILFNCYTEAFKQDRKEAIIVGACKTDSTKNKFSYGGRTTKGIVIPNGKLQQCTYINGNIVLIPASVYKVLGNLSSNYTHAMGDFDYGLRALQQNINCYTTQKYIAICELNSAIAEWCNPKISLKHRWKSLHSPKGLNIKEYTTFRKQHWKTLWVLFVVKAYLKMLFPSIYTKTAIN